MTRRLLRVHAVEDTAVQLVWSGLPARHVIVGVGSRSVEVDAPPPAWRHHGRLPSRPTSPWPAGPGAVVIDGLEPATTYPVWLREPGRARLSAGRVTTLGAPEGRLLCRFATVSDLHIGERRFGAYGSIFDVHPESAGLEPYPLRCARAALAEARAWGATTMIAKGDLTDRALPPQVAVASELLAGCGMRALIQLGNHDTLRPFDGSRWGPEGDVAHHGRIIVADLPGVRLVLADSPIPLERDGGLGDAQLEEIFDAVAEAEGPTIVSLHHPPMTSRVPRSYPPGLRREDSRRLLTGVRKANPATIILAGHSHRNRTRRMGGTLVVEVGSTKDYPGGWGGYAVHEGGIRQVVRRTAQPDVLAWTEATSAAVGGLWGRWSPGTLADRCWTHPWPAPTTVASTRVASTVKLDSGQ